jgi:hypothetical protein
MKNTHMREREREEPWILSGFCEEAEEPIARTDKETLLGILKAREANELNPNCSWVFDEM